MAPWSALYLHPGGWVGPCCWTDNFLGRITEDPDGPGLAEVWTGATARALRGALERDDFSQGCRKCGDARDRGDAEWAGMGTYEGWADRLDPHHPREIHFALSNTCNLGCVMCHGDLSSTIRRTREGRAPMPIAYGDRFFSDLRAFIPALAQATFTGGEPFLCRPTRRTWDLLREMGSEARVEVTTNGTQWNDHLAEYARALRMDLCVSVDGTTAETVETIREGAELARIVANIDAMRGVLATYGGSLDLNFCLMVQNVHEFGDFLAWADDLDAGVRVRPVYSPPRFSLFELPPAELASVVAALEGEDERRRSTLGRNRAVWIAELDRLRRWRDRREHGTETPVLAPTPRRADRRGEVIAELDRWSGREPIRVGVLDQVVREVDAPDWATGLGPDSWLGLGGLEMIGVVISRLGTQTAWECVQHDTDLLEYNITLGEGDSEVRLRALRLEDVEGDGTRRTTLLLATPDPLPEP